MWKRLMNDVRSGLDRPWSVENTDVHVGQVKVSVSPSGKAQDEAEREGRVSGRVYSAHVQGCQCGRRMVRNRYHGSSHFGLLSIKANCV